MEQHDSQRVSDSSRSTSARASTGAVRFGRPVLLLGLLVVTVAIAWTIRTHGWSAAWGQFGVEGPGAYSFLDTRIITGAAESFAAGYDPLRENPRDTFERPLNYPRIWHALAFLGVREADSEIVGSIFVALFLVGIGLAFDRLDVRTAVLLLLFLLSPAVLFGVERGNNDLVVFFLLGLALFVGRRNHEAGVVPIFCAAVLKLYPAFALGYGLRPQSRRALGVLAGATGLLAVYCVVTLDDLRAIRHITERSYVLSYGIETTEHVLRERFGIDAGGLRSVLLAGAALILVGAYLVARRLRSAPVDISARLDGYRVGAGVFLGTFLLVSSWSYRLMFLYFTIPALLEWIDARETPQDVRAASWVSLVLVFIAVWKTGNTPVAHLAIVWLLFALLGYLFARTLPVGLPLLGRTRAAVKPGR